MYAVSTYTPEDCQTWGEFVARSKNGTFLFSRPYMDYHAARFLDFSALVRDGRGKLVALFPANRAASTLLSHGGLSYGGMISDASMTTSRALDVFAAWIELCRRAGIDEINYKTVPSIYHREAADEDKYVLFCYGAELYRRDVLSVVDLSLPAKLQARRRRGVAKATRGSLRVAETADFETFWPMLTSTLVGRHAALPAHTLEDIQLLRSRFPRLIRLFGGFRG